MQCLKRVSFLSEKGGVGWLPDEPYFITLLTIELVIPHAQSLKDKRREVRGLKDRIRSKFNASVAKVGYQNKWQWAVLAVCLVASDKRQLVSDTARIRTLCEEATDVAITAIDQLSPQSFRDIRTVLHSV